MQVAIIPGPSKPKDLYSFLSPLIEELQCLSSRGMILKVNNEPDIHLFVHLLFATGDIPGVADLCHHSGHGSKTGCRTCRIMSTPLLSSKGAGTGQYFPGTNELEVERTVLEFQGKEVFIAKNPH